MLVAVVGTPLVGPGQGVIGDPPLVEYPSRPKIAGVDAALATDQVAFTYDDKRGRQILTITTALASTVATANGLQLALQGTLMSDPEVSIGLPAQSIVSA